MTLFVYQSFLDSIISDDDNNLHMEGSNPDHPNNIKREESVYTSKRY